MFPRPIPFRARRPAALSVLILAACLLAAAIAPAAAAERYEVAAGSHVLAVTGTAGLLGALGHRHAVLGRQVEGTVCYDPARAAATRGEVTVPTASLVIDSDEGLEMADLGDGPGEEDVQEIQAKMLSAEYLAADAHPEIRFDLGSVRVGREGPMQLRGEVTVRGVTQQVTVPAKVERRDGSVVVEGRFTIRQTDFGMEPESVAGVVKVADPVDVSYRLVLEPTGEACSDGGSGG